MVNCNLSGVERGCREEDILITLVFPPGMFAPCMRVVQTMLLLVDSRGLLIRVGVPEQHVRVALFTGARNPAVVAV